MHSSLVEPTFKECPISIRRRCAPPTLLCSIPCAESCSNPPSAHLRGRSPSRDGHDEDASHDLGHADAEFPARRQIFAGRDALGVGDVLHDPPAGGDVAPPGIGKHQLAMAPQQEADLQVLLQFRHPSARCRQGKAEPAAGGGEASRFDGGKQNGHGFETVHGLPRISRQIWSTSRSAGTSREVQVWPLINASFQGQTGLQLPGPGPTGFDPDRTFG
jgi:hypothetical protein